MIPGTRGGLVHGDVGEVNRWGRTLADGGALPQGGILGARLRQDGNWAEIPRGWGGQGDRVRAVVRGAGSGIENPNRTQT
jgi:hypothetical protein